MNVTKRELMQAFNNRADTMSLKSDVLMDGSVASQIAIVAEAPGEREVSMKLPLVGTSGRFLWDVLKKQNISRQHVYITNVVKRRLSFPMGSNPHKEPINKQELMGWIDLVRWELAQLPNLKYVLVLGNYALRALSGMTGITNWRGSVLSVKLDNGRPIKLVCANNPAAILREPKLEIVFRFDVAKLTRVMEGRHNPPTITAHINPSYDDAMDWIDQMHAAPKVSFDIETMGNETACVGLACNANEGMCINFRTQTQNRYTLEQEYNLRKRLSELLYQSNVKLVAQNGVFDSYWLWYKDRIRVSPIYMDTLLAHHTLYSQLPHSLGFLTSQYTDHPFYKDDGKSWRNDGDIDAFWEYNVKDACVTYAVAEKLEKELDAQGMSKFFFSHVMRLQAHLVTMTVGGVLIDKPLKSTIAENLHTQVANLEVLFHEAVHEAVGDNTYNPSPRSPKQLQELFFRRLKLIGQGTSTNAANRLRMMDHPRTPPAAVKMLTVLDEYKAEDKFLSTYAEMSIDPDNRVRCEYKQYGTTSAPGRLSSAKVMWGSGMNLQNQPERAYPMFIADEGYGFGYFDLAQAEARVVGWEARITSWMEQFERARFDGEYDCHRALAAEMYDIPYDSVPKHDREEDGTPTLRFIAKRCRHGLNYRMMAARLAETTGLSLHVATAAFHKYHRKVPELSPWWKSLEQEVRDTRCLYNAMGRRLMFLERLTPEALESIVAFKPQSLIGDKVSSVIYLSHDDEGWPEHSRIVLNIHDALIVQAPLSKIDTCLKIMKKHAESPVYIHGEPLIIPADCKKSVATVWKASADLNGTHTIKYRQDGYGLHRWYGMKKVQIDAS